MPLTSPKYPRTPYWIDSPAITAGGHPGAGALMCCDDCAVAPDVFLDVVPSHGGENAEFPTNRNSHARRGRSAGRSHAGGCA